ncbi:MAG: Nif11-like leader peptide family RiPP precursor [Oscillospiraceae bacterium]
MNTQEFIKKMSDDEALAKKMEGCKSPEEAFETAKAAGLTDDFESFKAVMTAVNKMVNGELSDDELDEVAGGMSKTTEAVIGIAGGIALSAGTAAAFLAASA